MIDLHTAVTGCSAGFVLWLFVYGLVRAICRAYFTERKAYLNNVLNQLKEHVRNHETE